MRSRRWFVGGILVLAVLVWGELPRRASAEDSSLTIFAAASLKNALDEIDQGFAAERGTPVRASYAASSALAKQLEQGAPADVFISADLDWMDYLDGRHLIAKETRSNLLANSIVLVATKDFRLDQVKIASDLDWSDLLAGGRLAMGQVDSVPAGKYGKAALEKLGAWSKVQTSLAQAESVRAALALVSRGEAPLGIVYKTDAAADAGVKIVGTFPADSHPPIIYPVAVTAGSSNPAAKDYLTYLRSPKAKTAFEKQGFTVLQGSGT